MSATLEDLVAEIAAGRTRPKATMINRRNPSAKQLKLRAIVEGVKAEASPCQWCEACKQGITDSTAIPAPSAAMCVEHTALSVEWSRWFATAAEYAPSILPSITSRGLEIVRQKVLAVIMKEVA